MNPDDRAKYLNGPESPLFHKGATLYGLPEARRIDLFTTRLSARWEPNARFRANAISPAPNRLEGLKLVASKPARRAKADGVRPSRRARLSTAFQSLACDSGMASQRLIRRRISVRSRNFYLFISAAWRSCHEKKVPTVKNPMMR